MENYKQLEAQGNQEYLERLNSIGWFDYPQNDRKILTDKINESTDDFYLHLHHFAIFSEDFYEIEDYINILKTLNEISGVNFEFPEFNVNDDDNIINIKFTITDNKFELNFDMNEPIMIPQIESEFNAVFHKLNLNSRLLWLPLESGIYFYVFIPVELYKKAVKDGIIPEESEYFESL
ncbi:MAG TPA: hypothetical protein VF676_03250 [Flavobacterium sp.]|jgi:hypothetical protein